MDNNIKRLLHTLFPFIIFVFIQRLLVIVTGRLELPIEPALTGLLCFLPASAAAVLLFRLKTYAPTDEEENDPIPPPEKSHPGHGLLGVVAAVAVMIVLMFLVSVPFSGSDSEAPAKSLTAFLSLVLIHPIAEEYIFRGLFYGELRKMNPVFGCLVQCVMFAIAHETVTGMIYALGSGIVLAYLMENTGRLWVPMAAHAIINFRSWLCLTVLAEEPLLCTMIDRIFIIGGFVCFILFLIIRNAPPRTGAVTDTTEDSDE